MYWEDVKICNCAGCMRQLVGSSMTSWYNSLKDEYRRAMKIPPLVFVYVDGRPYCKHCDTTGNYKKVPKQLYSAYR